ncbi:MAG: hypothetical protein AB7F31_01205 [Parachlamydiales bacterium]
MVHPICSPQTGEEWTKTFLVGAALCAIPVALRLIDQRKAALATALLPLGFAATVCSGKVGKTDTLREELKRVETRSGDLSAKPCWDADPWPDEITATLGQKLKALKQIVDDALEYQSKGYFCTNLADSLRLGIDEKGNPVGFIHKGAQWSRQGSPPDDWSLSLSRVCAETQSPSTLAPMDLEKLTEWLEVQIEQQEVVER